MVLPIACFCQRLILGQCVPFPRPCGQEMRKFNSAFISTESRSLMLPGNTFSRKAEGFLLITAEKRYLDAMKSIEDTLRVHPGCLQAHQNRIALLVNEFKNPNAAKIAYMDMKSGTIPSVYTCRGKETLKKHFRLNKLIVINSISVLKVLWSHSNAPV